MASGQKFGTELELIDISSQNEDKNTAIKSYFFKFIVPALIVILIANIVFQYPDNTSSDAIKKAWVSDNYIVVCDEYEKLIEKDFSNLENHRGYIRGQFKLSSKENISKNYSFETIKSKYLKYASDEESQISNIGYYGLGFYHSIRDPGLDSITGRAMTAVLLHMSLSVFAMCGIFYSKYRANGKHKLPYFALSFFCAIIIHGLYDFFLMADKLPPHLAIFSIIILIVSVNKLSIIIKNALNLSEFNSEEKLKVENISFYLVYCLSCVILLQYVLMAWKFGASNANYSVLSKFPTPYLLILVIILNLGKIEIKKSRWTGMFDKEFLFCIRLASRDF